jgi:hypothetical protein
MVRAPYVLAVAGSSIAVAAGAGATAVGGTTSISQGCPPTSGAASSTGDVVGSVTEVLHSRVYVDRSYVGAVPFKLVAGSRVCTDEKGEATIVLSGAGKPVTCILLARSALQVRSRSLDFKAGTTWCSVRRAASSFGAPPKSRVTTKKTPTVLGVVVERATTVKVSSGSVDVFPARGHTVPVPSGYRVKIDATGRAGNATKGLTLTIEERIAKLRLARS